MKGEIVFEINKKKKKKKRKLKTQKKKKKRGKKNFFEISYFQRGCVLS